MFHPWVWGKINQTSYFLIQFYQNFSLDISLELRQMLLALPPPVSWVLLFQSYKRCIPLNIFNVLKSPVFLWMEPNRECRFIHCLKYLQAANMDFVPVQLKVSTQGKALIFEKHIYGI